MNLWDQVNNDFKIERQQEKIEACGIHQWILAYPDGTRELKPFHCKECEKCKQYEAMKLKDRLLSSEYIDQLKFIKAPAKAVTNFVKNLETKDYARFPSVDGSDYLFSVNGVGIRLLDADPDWRAVISRRKGTRKSGKLIVLKKEKPEQTIPLRNIRVASEEIALDVLGDAQEKFDEEILIEDETNLVVNNNIVTAFLLKQFESKRVLVFDAVVNRGYSLPLLFSFKIERKEHG